jgi:hypothetical protein
VIRFLYDRREASREPNPLCPMCPSPTRPASLRTERGIYFRCQACDEMFGREKPAPGLILADDKQERRRRSDKH